MVFAMVMVIVIMYNAFLCPVGVVVMRSWMMMMLMPMLLIDDDDEVMMLGSGHWAVKY